LLMKSSSVFVCQSCGFESAKWQGRCPSCGEWNSMVETQVSTMNLKVKSKNLKINPAKVLRLDQVESLKFKRITTGIGELDRVLGGGIVPGSVVLLAGEPGMGKSTLLTQLALELASGLSEKDTRDHFSKSLLRDSVGKSKHKLTGPNANIFSKDRFASFSKEAHKIDQVRPKLSPVLYVCGEESPGQVKLRIERLATAYSSLRQLADRSSSVNSSRRLAPRTINPNLYLLPETNVEAVIETAANELKRAKLVIIDSIQTMWSQKLSGMAGSVGQIRECTQILLQYAKENQVPVFLVGHVTKEGSIAGPKILEHLVDTVLYMEGERQHEFRILRAAKNRFGPTDEVGIFIMEDNGMKEVTNPAEVFLEDSVKGRTLRTAGSDLKRNERAGSCTVVTMQGVRPVLVEIQALTVPSQLPVPRRVARGIDNARLQILCAVLQKKAGISIYNHDIFLSVAGGLRVFEPAIDFGICLSVASSYKNKTLAEKSVAIGEVGLLGEIRRVPFLEKRVKQAKALGYSKIIGPEQYATIGEAIRKLLR
jgi:DNA repair protein RadA/Sms